MNKPKLFDVLHIDDWGVNEIDPHPFKWLLIIPGIDDGNVHFIRFHTRADAERGKERWTTKGIIKLEKM